MSGLVVFFTIEGIGDAANGLWKFSSAVPAYGGDEFKPWMLDWPMPSTESVDELGSSMTAGDIEFVVTDVGQALTDLFRLLARPDTYLAEDISSADTAFQIEKQAVDPPGASDLMWVGMEVMLRGADSGSDVTVTRARLGTSAIPHPTGTPVYSSPHHIGGRVARLYYVDAGAASSAAEELIAEYILDKSAPSSDMTSWSFAGRSRLSALARKIGRGAPRPTTAKTLTRSGVLFFTPIGAEPETGNGFSDALGTWSDGGHLLLGDELIEVGTSTQPYACEVTARARFGTELNQETIDRPCELALVASTVGPGAFRYSASNSTTRASGWSKTEHWVDILLCLLTSSADADDDLELTNGDAAYGNWSSLPVGWGVGIPVAQIDLQSFAEVKARTLNWTFPGLRVTRDAGSFGAWATKTILRVVGAYLVTVSGGLTLRMTRIPAPLDTASEVDEETLLEQPVGEFNSSDMVSEVTFKMTGPRGQSVTETYRAQDVIDLISSGGRYEADLREISIEAPGIMANETGAPGWLRNAGQRTLFRRARPRWDVHIVSDIQNRTIGPGNVVNLTCSNLPNLEDGTMGWTSVPCIALEGQPQVSDEQASVSHRLVVYNASSRVRNVAPAAVISSVSTNTATMHANKFSETDATEGMPQTDAAGFSVGMVVELRNPDGTETVAGTQTVTNVSGNDITLDGNFSGSLASGKVLVLAQHDSARTEDKATYAHAGSLTGHDILSGGDLLEYGEL